MLFPAALVCSLLAAGATARPLGTTSLPDELPPWGAALLAKVGKLEGTISTLQTTIHDHSARIRELEAAPSQPGDGSYEVHHGNFSLTDIMKRQSQTIQDHAKRIAEPRANATTTSKASDDGSQHICLRRVQILETRVGALEGNNHSGAPRRLQGGADQGSVVQQFKSCLTAADAGGLAATHGGAAAGGLGRRRRLQVIGCPGHGTSGPGHGGHRRRVQAKKKCLNLAKEAKVVQGKCCDEPSEVCTGGKPSTCNAGCAAVFLPFWADCGSVGTFTACV
jgi:hypothetical protein